MASIPAAATTRRGALWTSRGSRMTAPNRAFSSPQAIFRWVSAWAISAKDWASLPLPAVVGIPMEGSMGRSALPDAPVVLHAAALGEEEVDALGAVHGTASAETCNEVDAILLPCKMDARLHLARRRIFPPPPSNTKCSMDSRCMDLMALRAMPARATPGSVTSMTRRPPSFLIRLPNPSRVSAPKTRCTPG